MSDVSSGKTGLLQDDSMESDTRMSDEESEDCGCSKCSRNQSVSQSAYANSKEFVLHKSLKLSVWQPRVRDQAQDKADWNTFVLATNKCTAEASCVCSKCYQQ